MLRDCQEYLQVALDEPPPYPGQRVETSRPDDLRLGEDYYGGTRSVSAEHSPNRSDKQFMEENNLY